MGLVFEPSVPLSKIATSDTHGEDSPYFAGWKAYDEDPYDPIINPSGVIQMGLAENQVSFDLLENYLEEHPEASKWGNGISSFRENALFQDYHGLKTFRKAMASFMEQIRGGRTKFDSDRIVLTAGATAANELLTFILADPGDALLIPTPYYPGFDRDLRWRTGVNIIPVRCNSSNGFQITLQALEDAYAEAEAAKIRVRGIQLTNPSNPLGTAITRSVLEVILDFATRKNIHLISDEIYSGSVFSQPEFVSIAEIVEAQDCRSSSERVHIVYSLSKDLGLPGFRVGTIYSYNNEVVTTARRMSSFTLVSSQTQRMLASMLSDEEFTKNYIRTNRERLRKRYEYIIEELKAAGIECLQGNGGLFCWMNLGPLLEVPTREGEVKLWNLILNEVKLNISPGSSSHCSDAGWFRVCFANMNLQTLEVALRRINSFMQKRRGTSQGLS
ncbi:1-aminocyclopropane-1-carboxylate synthase 7-like [Typha angustifolia]|uniref:1-aminocyclopropane-1-carboxylate synthase 7-like n=1 Tax=Typha angustifolia TaxID=59011 RepID=UPI003C2ACE7C